MRNPQGKANLAMLQKPDSKEALLHKMRGRLAGPSEFSLQRAQRIQAKSAHRRRITFWQVFLCLAFIAANAVLYTQRDTLMVRLGLQGVPRLAAPSASLDPDQQALYWTYALYDYDKLKARFGVGDKVIIDTRLAQDRLQALLPKVRKVETFRELSMYTPGRRDRQ